MISLRNALSAQSFRQLAGLSAVWLVMTEGAADSWLIGLPVILLVIVFQRRPHDERHRPLSIGGILAYLPFFFHQSVLSGFDVALRAWRVDMGLHPAVTNYRIRLPEGAARRLFINSTTLMPGTLSIQVTADTLRIHVLDERQDVMDSMQRLEHRVGAVYGFELEEGKKY